MIESSGFDWGFGFRDSTALHKIHYAYTAYAIYVAQIEFVTFHIS